MTSPGVLYADESVVTVSAELVEQLRAGAANTLRGRMRLCAHQRVEDAVHEMIIVLRRDSYVRPHKHEDKTESFHIIAGEAEVVLFDDLGGVREVIELGTYGSGKCFFYRCANSFYHTVLVRSDDLVMHETTNGPFDPRQTVFAPWAPKEGELVEIAAFAAHLHRLSQSALRKRA